MREYIKWPNPRDRSLHRWGMRWSDVMELRNSSPSPEEQSMIDRDFTWDQIYWKRAKDYLPQPFNPETYRSRLEILREALATNGMPGFSSIVECAPKSDGTTTYKLPGISSWYELYSQIFDHEQSIDDRYIKGKAGHLYKSHIPGDYSRPYVGGYKVDAFGDGVYNRLGRPISTTLYKRDPEHELMLTFYNDIHVVLVAAGRIALNGTNLPESKVRPGFYSYDEYDAYETIWAGRPKYDSKKFKLLAEVAARSILELNPAIS